MVIFVSSTHGYIAFVASKLKEFNKYIKLSLFMNTSNIFSTIFRLATVQPTFTILLL